MLASESSGIECIFGFTTIWQRTHDIRDNLHLEFFFADVIDNADVIQVSVMLVVIEGAANDESIRNFETHIICKGKDGSSRRGR